MPKTARKSTKNRGTRSVRKPRLSKQSDVPKDTQIVRVLMEMLNVVKLYHWKTHSHPEHTATDQLYGRLNENIDKFVETLLGKKGTRIQKWNTQMQIPQYATKSPFKDRIYEYREFLIQMNQHLDSKKDSDLLNIRDEILGDINQFLYLMTLH